VVKKKKIPEEETLKLIQEYGSKKDNARLRAEWKGQGGTWHGKAGREVRLARVQRVLGRSGCDELRLSQGLVFEFAVW
jgi:hypothetical protein